MLIRNKFDFSVENSKVAEAAKMDGFSGTGKSNSPLSEAKGHIVYPFLRKKVLHITCRQKSNATKCKKKIYGKNRAFSMAKH